MSFFSRILGGRERAIERGLHDMYTQVLSTVAGFTPIQAEEAVSDAIAACKQQAKTDGTADLPEDFGDRIIQAARMGEPKSRRIVDKARREGATDDDIREWWSLPDLCRRMVLWSENLFCYSVFLHAREEDGLSAEQAAGRVHKMFPIYGDPEDTTKLCGEDRPLPHELRGRVDSYKQAHGAQRIGQQVTTFPSYNAFVRDAIRKRVI